MLDQPNPTDALAQAILGLLIDDHPGLWSMAELDRTLTPSTRPAASHETVDAVETLHAAGLLNRVGDYVFASRAAHAAQRLAG
jgi:hypothetical protein